MALSHSGIWVATDSPGIILKTRKFMHFSKYVIIFTVDISLDIALSL